MRCSVGRCRVAEGPVLARSLHDPDGDGDVHLLLWTAQKGMVFVKLPPSAQTQEIPGIGSHVRAVGPWHTSSNGTPEILAVRWRTI